MIMKSNGSKRAYFIITLIIIITLISCTVQEGKKEGFIVEGISGQEIDTKLTPLIEDVLQTHDLPGMAVGVVKENEIIYARGFGYKNIETKTPITISTLFHMASISKPFVATAVMQLVEQEKIDLEAPVIIYLPYFRLKGESYKAITIQQMLTHTSGMPDVEDYEWDKPQYDEGAIERYVRTLADLEMRHAPGEKFAYSNMAFECLGDVISKVSGMSFDDYEKMHVLDPAGMKESTFLKPEHLPENWASPHLRTVQLLLWDGYPYNRSHGPSSTLHSNVLEMCRWAMINLNRGTLQGRQVLEPSSYELLWTPKAETGRSGYAKSVGLSWFIGEYRGQKCVGHGGGDTGFNTMLIMMPEKSLAAVVLCNFIPAPVEAIAKTALDIALGSEPERILPPASIAVSRTLSDTGVDSAAEQWNSLQKTHAREYNFSEDQFYYLLLTSLELDRVADAESWARFCMTIMPESFPINIKSHIASFVERNPQNRAGAAVLKILNQQ